MPITETPVFDTDTWTAEQVEGDVTFTVSIAGAGSEDEADVLADMNAAGEVLFPQSLALGAPGTSTIEVASGGKVIRTLVGDHDYEAASEDEEPYGTVLVTTRVLPDAADAVDAQEAQTELLTRALGVVRPQKSY
jgi:hypothetical protein